MHKLSLFCILALAILSNAPAAMAARDQAEPQRGHFKLFRPELPRPLAAGAVTHGNIPRQFAVGMKTAIDARSGSWQDLGDGRSALTLTIESEGAKSLNLSFADLRLPVSAQLRVRSRNGATEHGPFDFTRIRNGKLWTPIVEGDGTIVEVIVGTAQRDAVGFRIEQVGYGYVSLNGSLMGESGACQVDIGCNEAAAWTREARAVAVYTFGGEFSCTGTLMNNTAQDETPYLLTAAHCITSADEAASMVVYWKFQASACGAKDGDLKHSQAGADLVARSPDWFHSDFALVKLWDKPNPEFNVYYAGWDRRPVAPQEVAVIHHPNGDEKKFNRSTVPTSIVSAFGSAPDASHPWKKPSYIRVESWDVGALEYGSSGSALWNSERRVVAHATAATAYCENQQSWSLFGSLGYDWDGLPGETESLAKHLDPLGTGVEFMDGLDPLVPKLKEAPLPASGGGAFSLMQVLLLAVAVAARRRRAA